MADSTRRYTFHPLERRGVLVGLQSSQIFLVIGGLLLAFATDDSIGGAAGPAVAAVLFAACLVVALWPAGGRPLVEWVPIAVSWLARRSSGVTLSGEPLAGAVGTIIAGSAPTRRAGASTGTGAPTRRAATLRQGPGRRTPAPLTPAGIELVELPAQPGQPPVGLIRDLRCAAWAAVVPVQGRSFSLLDPGEQVQRLEAWRTVLGALARPGSPLRRVQWVERSGPASDRGLTESPQEFGDSDPITAEARCSYQELVSRAAPAQSHEVRVVLSVAATGGPRRREGMCDALRRELRLLDGHLVAADLRPGPPLRLRELVHVVGEAHGRNAARTVSRADTSSAWPMASDEQWSSWRSDNAWHATYWIAEWPQVEVPPDFLSPLLLGPGQRAVSVVMAPVPNHKAVREVRSARTADLADAEIRSRAGFLSSVRRDKEAEGVVRREHELAEGHCEYRFSGYVTVTAADTGGLDTACAEAERHAAQAARLELRRLYGRQAEAFTWTLPLARGLV